MSGWGELSLTSAWNWDWITKAKLAFESWTGEMPALHQSFLWGSGKQPCSSALWEAPMLRAAGAGLVQWLRSAQQEEEQTAGPAQKRRDPDPALGTSVQSVSASLTSQQQTKSELAERTLLCLPRKSHLPPLHSLWPHCRPAPKGLIFWATHILIPRGKPWPLQLHSPPLTTAIYKPPHLLPLPSPKSLCYSLANLLHLFLLYSTLCAPPLF